MAQDRLSIKLVGGARLERLLLKFSNSVGTTLAFQSLNKGAAAVRKVVRTNTPVTTLGDTKGFKDSSRNIRKGQLKRSVISGLRRRVKVPRNVFLAGVWFQTKRGGATADKDGFFAKQVLERHAANPFGFKGGNNFLKKSVNKSRSVFQRIVGVQLGEKIAGRIQKEIDSLG